MKCTSLPLFQLCLTFLQVKELGSFFICIQLPNPEFLKAFNNIYLIKVERWLHFEKDFLPKSRGNRYSRGIWYWGCPHVSNDFTILFSNSSVKRLLLKPTELLHLKFQWHLAKHFRTVLLQIKFVQHFSWLAPDSHSD